MFHEVKSVGYVIVIVSSFPTVLACLRWPSHCSLSVQVMPSQRNQRMCIAMHTVHTIVGVLVIASNEYPKLELFHVSLIQVLNHCQRNVLYQRKGAATR